LPVAKYFELLFEHFVGTRCSREVPSQKNDLSRIYFRKTTSSNLENAFWNFFSHFCKFALRAYCLPILKFCGKIQNRSHTFICFKINVYDGHKLPKEQKRCNPFANTAFFTVRQTVRTIFWKLLIENRHLFSTY